MFRYPDPLDDHKAWEAELARLDEQVPRCCEHTGPVMEDFYYELNDDRPICAECLEKHHKKINLGNFDMECDYCGEYIDDEHYYKNDEYEVYCKACVDKHFKKKVEVW